MENKTNNVPSIENNREILLKEEHIRQIEQLIGRMPGDFAIPLYSLLQQASSTGSIGAEDGKLLAKTNS